MAHFISRKVDSADHHKCIGGQAAPGLRTGENVRDWLHVEDHAEALLLVAERGWIGESYNIGGRSERANIEVVRAICGLVDELAPDASIGTTGKLITFVSDRPGHDARYAMDASKVEPRAGLETTPQL